MVYANNFFFGQRYLDGEEADPPVQEHYELTVACRNPTNIWIQSQLLVVGTDRPRNVPKPTLPHCVAGGRTRRAPSVELLWAQTPLEADAFSSVHMSPAEPQHSATYQQGNKLEELGIEPRMGVPTKTLSLPPCQSCQPLLAYTLIVCLCMIIIDLLYD